MGTIDPEELNASGKPWDEMTPEERQALLEWTARMNELPVSLSLRREQRVERWDGMLTVARRRRPITELDKQVADRIRRARLWARLTQRRLAEEAGVTQSRICRIERLRSSMTIAELAKIAERLCVEPERFVVPDAELVDLP